MNAAPALMIPHMDAVKLLSRLSLNKTLSPGLTPFLIKALAIRLALRFSSSYVNSPSSAINASLSLFSATVSWNTSFRNGLNE